MDDQSHRLTPDEQAFALLEAGIPLTLLLDLAMPLDSRALLRDEPADTAWLHASTG